MSTRVLDDVLIPENMVRDWFYSNPSDTDQTLNVVNDQAVGLDLFIRNRGAATITLAVEGQGNITIDPGDPFTWNNQKFGLIAISATDDYDFLLTGVKFQTLKARGLM